MEERARGEEALTSIVVVPKMRTSLRPTLGRALNILLVAERYAPSIGGVETVTRLLAEAFSRAGHVATVVTREPGTFQCPTNVVRRPGILSLLRLFRRADAVILQGMALRLGWPLLLRHPCVLMVHHTPSPREERECRVTRRLRATLGSRVRHGAVSRAMVSRLPWPVETILPNPYDTALFGPGTSVGCRRPEVVFVGRLVPEKGAHVLIEALGILHRTGRHIRATIIGSGEERFHLAALAHQRCVSSHIHFAGEVSGGALAQRLKEHRILVVPSIDESFGIVALEGAACGCAVIASNVGGLPEAVGPYGWLFPVGDAANLAAKLIQMLECETTDQSVGLRQQEHLRNHSPDSVARVYLKTLERVSLTELGGSVI